MQIFTMVLQIITVICFFSLFLVIKFYFPSYMNKKGENLATKEDIAEITKRTEEVQKDFKEQFELFSSDVRFKYDFTFRQYSELYCKLYAIIIQSEYVRFFLDKKDGTHFSFDEAPFVEIGPTERRTNKYDFNNGKTLPETKTEIIETDISKFNKKALADYIIMNGNLASQQLLKVAVSYRFAHEYYSGNKSSSIIEAFQKTADEEEFRLIREMVICIVREYNGLRKDLKLSFDDTELETGIPHC